MLTGDKIETAINIAYSCKLLNGDEEIIIIDYSHDNELLPLIKEKN